MRPLSFVGIALTLVACGGPQSSRMLVRRNQGPAAVNLALSGVEDQATRGALKASDPEGDALTFEVVTAPEVGELTLNPATGEFVYTPPLNFNGVARFTYVARDGQTASPPSVVTLDLSPVNDPPSVGALTTLTERELEVGDRLLAQDPEGDPVVYVVVVPPSHGTLNLNSLTGGFNYAPEAGYEGPDQFVYRVLDAENATSVGSVVLGVTPMTFRWQNPLQPHDVNGDGVVSALDALVIINRLNAGVSALLDRRIATPPQYFVDVTGDNRITSADALAVISHLNGG